MLIVQNVSYEVGGKTVLNNVSFTLNDTEKVGLVGINGVGKTTLFRLIAGLAIPSSGVISFSSQKPIVGFMPQTITDLEVPQKTSVFNFLLSGRPVESIGEKIRVLLERLAVISDPREQKSALEQLGRLQQEFEYWGGYNAKDELLRIINGLQMEGIDLNAEVGVLSGGEKSKVNFARVLYSNPDLLLLDEPTNHLDNRSREWLIGFIKQFPACVLIISHNTHLLDAVANKIIRLDETSRSADVFHGNYSQHLKVLEQRLTTLQKTAGNQQKERERLQKYLNRMQGVSGKTKRQVASRERRLEQLERDRVEVPATSRVLQTKLLPKRKGNETPLTLCNVSYGYLKNKKVLSNISLTLSRNERLVVVGFNGAGKSTLLKLIAGSLKPQSGEIIVGSKTDIAFYTQEHEEINLRNTVLEEVRTVSDLPIRNLRSVLASFLFKGEVAFQSVATLSPGERSRLALAKLSLKGANLLLLDEPSNHLDTASSSAVALALSEYEGSFIVVSHDITFIEALGVERMLLLPSGQTAYYDRSAVEEYHPTKGQSSRRRK